MATRAAQAASSTQAKRELVRLLFGKQYSRQGMEAHRKLVDSSMYSYQELRIAYLERVKELHPDQNKEDSGDEFLALREAWERYNEYAKMIRSATGKEEPASFTMFGVGCSFSDSHEERQLRDEITSQACRGWFSSGSLGQGGEKQKEDGSVYAKSRNMKSQNLALADESMFVQEVGENHDAANEKNVFQEAEKQTRRPKTLVGHLIRPQKR